MSPRPIPRFPLLLGALVLLAAAVPYLAGYRAAAPGAAFLGAIENPGDTNPYVSWVRQSASGRFLMENLYSPEPTEAHLFNLLTFVTGVGARLFHVSPAAAYQASRAVTGAMLIAAIWWACTVFAPGARTRRLAFAWIVLGAGFGWLRAGNAIDFNVPEAYAFYSILVFPHLSASMALTIVALTAYWQAIRDCAARWAVVAGVAALALGAFHPYPLLVIGVVVVIHALYRVFRRRVTRQDLVIAALVLIPVAVALLWNLYQFSLDPVLAGWRRQNITVSCPPLDYVTAYGLAGCLLPLALYRLRRYPSADGVAFLGSWILATALLTYAPLAFQRRLIEGVQVPVVLIAALAVTSYMDELASRQLFWRARGRAAGLMIALVLVSAPSTALLVLRGVTRVRSGDPYLYVSKDELAALRWLDEHAAPRSVVFSWWETGNRIPRFTDCRVYAGHTCQTLDFAQKTPYIEGFFASPITEEQRRGFLDHFGVDWILVGPWERALGGYDPASSSQVSEAFRAGEFVVYRVRRT